MKKWVLFAIHGYQVLCESKDLMDGEHDEDGTNYYVIIRIPFDGVDAEFKLAYYDKASRDEAIFDEVRLEKSVTEVFSGAAAMLGIEYGTSQDQS